ncbi:hypothetical protein [Sphingomonas corticis]|uniref:Antitoxin Xre/MbcA/ParS-like toxin-binding domain-containing protein n=1 Tax=Sphingomonas corticis TaxID=2722791 RepID=A0ABX1CQ43_9SPHN|nr:hypothetical protein [Sphingomonas corticis]NJR80061.1 hypothetical protein [Sphingomonas corticis]
MSRLGDGTVRQPPSGPGGMRSEDAEEFGLVIRRLVRRVEDADLLGGQVEVLLGLGFGEWSRVRAGRPGWRLSPRQERCARLAVELLDGLEALLGGWASVRPWLEAPSGHLDGGSPLEWAGLSPAHLSALVACLRAEAS